MEKQILLNKINEGYSLKKLSIFFNLTVPQIRYQLAKYNLSTSGYTKIHNWSKEELLLAINNSECKSDILRNLGISTKSGNFQTLERYCVKYDINIDNLKYKNDRGNRFKRILETKDIFVENSPYSTKTTKDRVLKDNLIKYKCCECNNLGEWNGKKLNLHLDHKNGVNNDNRLINLRFLCPNCHSQTETYGGKNKKVR